MHIYIQSHTMIHTVVLFINVSFLGNDFDESTVCIDIVAKFLLPSESLSRAHDIIADSRICT